MAGLLDVICRSRGSGSLVLRMPASATAKNFRFSGYRAEGAGIWALAQSLEGFGYDVSGLGFGYVASTGELKASQSKKSCSLYTQHHVGRGRVRSSFFAQAGLEQ